MSGGGAGGLDASEGRSLYGLDPATYAAGRPDYPAEVYAALAEQCGLGEGATVVEIGPGTGLVTAHLDAGARVAAVEPDARMAAYLEMTLGCPTLHVINAAFEDAPLASGAFDLAVAANSFHWVAQPAGFSVLRRVLRPGASAAIWWMFFDADDSPDAFDEAAARILSTTSHPPERPTPFHRDVAARCADLTAAGFADVASTLIPTPVTLDAAGIRALYATMAVVLRRRPDEQRDVLDELEAEVADRFGGSVQRAFVTALYRGVRPPDGAP